MSYKFPRTVATADGDIGVAGNWSNGVPGAGLTGSIPSGRTMTVGVDSTVSNLEVQPGGSLVMNANLTVTGSLTLGTSINTGSSTLGLGCNATVSGASETNYVIGNIKKDYCQTGAFTYPTGTANGYSPASVNVTALGTNPSSLEVKATQGNRAGMDGTESAQRYWELLETGDLTVDMTFNYRDVDVAGTEANYKLFRFVGPTATPITPFTLDTAANTVSVSGVSSFSDWAIGNLAPTAASAEITGIALSQERRALPRVIVTLTDGNGNIISTRTNGFGFFRFSNIQVGETYVLNAYSKGSVFPSRVITLNEDIVGLEIVPNE